MGFIAGLTGVLGKGVPIYESPFMPEFPMSSCRRQLLMAGETLEKTLAHRDLADIPMIAVFQRSFILILV